MWKREIIFRARSIHSGEWITGNYADHSQKGGKYFITPKDSNIGHEVDRDSLQLKNRSSEWEDVDVKTFDKIWQSQN